MSWETAFSAANIMAMIAWIGLIFLPRWPALLAACLYAGVGLLSLAYTVLIIGFLTGGIDPGPGNGGEASFSSIEGVKAALSTDGGLTMGWIHYLAFDLFVGIWIARDADAKGFSRILQAPILFFTFMAGPVGLFLWLVIREKRARESGRFS